MTISLATITEKTLNDTSNGIFDTLLHTAKIHLEEEFTKKRISAAEYSKVYISLIESVLAASVQFGLQLEKANKEVEVAEQNRLNAVKQNEVLENQRLKLIKETELLAQKIITEVGQTSDTFLTVPIEGILGQQRALLKAQEDGFQRNAEQKVLKTMADVWSVQYNANSTDVSSEGTRLANPHIGLAVEQALLGAGITAADIATADAAVAP